MELFLRDHVSVASQMSLARHTPRELAFFYPRPLPPLDYLAAVSAHAAGNAKCFIDHD